MPHDHDHLPRGSEIESHHFKVYLKNLIESNTQTILTKMADLTAQFKQAVADINQATSDVADRLSAQLSDLKKQIGAGISQADAFAAIEAMEADATKLKAIGVDVAVPTAPVPAPAAAAADAGTSTSGTASDSTGTPAPVDNGTPATTDAEQQPQ